MLDDLRNSASGSYFDEGPEGEDQAAQAKKRLRLDARQRFMVSMGLLVLVLIVSTIVLVSTGKMFL